VRNHIITFHSLFSFGIVTTAQTETKRPLALHSPCIAFAFTHAFTQGATAGDHHSHRSVARINQYNLFSSFARERHPIFPSYTTMTTTDNDG
jgi:hypothetical protein